MRTSEICCVSEVVLRIAGRGIAPRFHAPRAFHDGKAVISRPQVISRIRRIHFIAAECRFQCAGPYKTYHNQNRPSIVTKIPLGLLFLFIFVLYYASALFFS